MDRKDIIHMAWEANVHHINLDNDYIFEFERFAALVAEQEREAIIEILSLTEFTSLDHMPHEAALIIRLRGGP